MFKTSEINPGTTQPLLIDATAVGALLGRCAKSIYRDDHAGRIPSPVLVGGSRRWRLSELRRWADAGCPSRDAWEQRSGHAVDRRETNDSKGGA